MYAAIASCENAVTELSIKAMYEGITSTNKLGQLDTDWQYMVNTPVIWKGGMLVAVVLRKISVACHCFCTEEAQSPLSAYVLLGGELHATSLQENWTSAQTIFCQLK